MLRTTARRGGGRKEEIGENDLENGVRGRKLARTSDGRKKWQERVVGGTRKLA